MSKNINIEIIKKIIFYSIFQSIIIISLTILINKEIINFNKKLIKSLYIIFFIFLSSILITDLIFHKSSKKKKGNIHSNSIILFIIYFIINILSYKYLKENILISLLDLLKMDLKTLENFVKNNKEINNEKDLYLKVKDLLNKLNLENNEKLNEDFLYDSSYEKTLMYYYLAKYPNDCSYFGDIKISLPSKPYFEINKKNENDSKIFIKNLIKNRCKKKRFLFLDINLNYEKNYEKDDTGGNHSVLIILDFEKNTIEYFDPNISQVQNENKINKYTIEQDEEHISKIFKNYFEDFKEIDKNFADDFISNYGSKCYRRNILKLGLQYLDENVENKSKEKYIEKEGYCINWSWFYLLERLKPENRDLNQIEIIQNLIKKWNSGKDQITYINKIRTFAVFQKIYSLINKYYSSEFTYEEIGKIAVEVFTKKEIF